LDLPAEAGRRVPTSHKGVQVEVVQVFHSFMLAQVGAVDSPGAPENPAVRFRIVGSPAENEQHLSFTKFPEFRVEPPEGETWLVRGGEWEPNADAGVEQQLAIVHEAEGRWVPWTSWHDPTDGAPLSPDETRTLDNGRLSIRVLDEAERGVLSRVVVQTSKEVQNPVLLVRLVEDGKGEETPRHAGLISSLWRPTVRRADVKPNEVWLFHGDAFQFETPQGPIDVAYRTRNIPLVRYPARGLPGGAVPRNLDGASFESDALIHPPAGEPSATTSTAESSVEIRGTCSTRRASNGTSGRSPSFRSRAIRACSFHSWDTACLSPASCSYSS
jgi:hypothetical protein